MDEYKIAIIYGTTDEQRNIKEGNIEKIGDINDPYLLHSSCLLDFARTKYPDIKIFQKLTYRSSPETIGYFFAQLGHILFLNTTKKGNKTGLFIMPDNITERQKNTLYNFAEHLAGFTVGIFYDLNLISGIVDGRELYQSTIKNETISSLLDTYFSPSEDKEKKRYK